MLNNLVRSARYGVASALRHSKMTTVRPSFSLMARRKRFPLRNAE